MLVNFSMYNRTLGMIFELCEGGQLNKLLHNPDNSPTRRFNTGRKMAMAKDVAIGLEYIHSMRSLCVCVCVCVWCLRQFLYLKSCIKDTCKLHFGAFAARHLAYLWQGRCTCFSKFERAHQRFEEPFWSQNSLELSSGILLASTGKCTEVDLLSSTLL